MKEPDYGMGDDYPGWYERAFWRSPTLVFGCLTFAVVGFGFGVLVGRL